MKKMICAIIAIILIFPVIATADRFNSSYNDSSMSIDEALQIVKYTSRDRIPINNDLSNYRSDNYADDIDLNGWKIIILERTAADKAFKGYDSGYPNNYIEQFPSDFMGEDAGNPMIWLRCG